MRDSMDKLGVVLKDARQRAGRTQKEVAAKLQITSRHLMSIENGRQKPSYDLLYLLIRELSISADLIFYPGKVYESREFEQAVTLLRKCNVKELGVITATLQSLLKEE